MIGGEVGVPHGHRQGGVAEDLFESLEAAAPHDEPTREVVATVMEVEVVEFCLHDRVLERGAYVAGPPDAPLALSGEAGQDVVDSLAHRNITALARLRSGAVSPRSALQTDDASAQVHAVPRQPEQLALP